MSIITGRCGHKSFQMIDKTDCNPVVLQPGKIQAEGGGSQFRRASTRIIGYILSLSLHEYMFKIKPRRYKRYI